MRSVMEGDFTRVLRLDRKRATQIVSAFGTKWSQRSQLICGSESRFVYLPVLGSHVGTDTILSLSVRR